MNLTKIKQKELKRGDIFCEDVWSDNIVRVASRDGSTQIFDPSIRETKVYRIDAPDFTHELTQFSWKLKQLDDTVCGMQLVGDEVERLQRENEKLSATIDKVRVAMRQRGSVVAIQAVNQTIYEHDHGEDDKQRDLVEKLAVDSVALDKIIDVVEAWDHGLERSPDVRMKEIAKIVEERGD